MKQNDVVEHSHYLKSKIQISYKKLLSRCQFKKLRLKSFKDHILASGVVQILWTNFWEKSGSLNIPGIIALFWWISGNTTP